MSQPEMVGFIEKFRAMLAEFPGTFTVAEVGGPNPIQEMKSFTEGADRLNSAYNFDFLYAPDLTASRVIESANLWDQSEGEGWPSWAFSNHDAPRAVTRWASASHRDEMARLYMMLLMSLRGNPIIYQGEELGLPQAHVPYSHLKDPEAITNWPKTLGRDGARTPIPWESSKQNAGFSSGEPWLPVDPEHTRLSVDTQQGNDSMLRFTKDALATRGRHTALISGAMQFHTTGREDLLAIARAAGDDQVVAVFNFGAEELRIPDGINIEGDVILASKPLKEDALVNRHISARTGVWLRLK